MKAAIKLLLAALREIFDENAYARFLAAHRLASSPAAYRQFLEHRFSGAPRRCC